MQNLALSYCAGGSLLQAIRCQHSPGTGFGAVVRQAAGAAVRLSAARSYMRSVDGHVVCADRSWVPRSKRFAQVLCAASHLQDVCWCRVCRALVCKTVAGFLPPAAGIVRKVLPAMCMWVGCVSVVRLTGVRAGQRSQRRLDAIRP